MSLVFQNCDKIYVSVSMGPGERKFERIERIFFRKIGPLIVIFYQRKLKVKSLELKY
jgi:hypothetical protein